MNWCFLITPLSTQIIHSKSVEFNQNLCCSSQTPQIFHTHLRRIKYIFCDVISIHGAEGVDEKTRCRGVNYKYASSRPSEISIFLWCLKTKFHSLQKRVCTKSSSIADKCSLVDISLIPCPFLSPYTKLRRCLSRVSFESKMFGPSKRLPGQILDRVNLSNLAISLAKTPPTPTIR